MRGGDILKYNDIKSRVDNNTINPVYLFLGEEKYLKQEIINIIKKKIITTGFSFDFNYHHYYSSNTDLNHVIDICNTLPVFSDKRLVILEDVEKFKKPKVLKDYLSSPSLNTVLILNSTERKINIPHSKINKLTIVTFYPLYDNALIGWIIKKCQQNKKDIPYNAAQRLTELCDNSLLEINNEVEKLLIYCKDKKEIAREDVKNLIGDIKGYDIFKLMDAVLSSQYQLSLRILKKLFESGNKIYSLFAMLNRSLHQIFYIKFLLEIKKLNQAAIIKKFQMNPYRYKTITANIRKYDLNQISRVIRVLFEFDYKLKSHTAKNEKRLFEDLIFQLKLK